MAIKPITKFKGDSWKKQESESDRAHHYFKDFRVRQLSRDKYIEFLISEADERSSKGHLKFWTSDKTFNKKNQKQIQLYVDTNGKQGQCPKPCGTLADWFKYHKWSKRRTDYVNFLDEDSVLLVKAIITEERVQMAHETMECFYNTAKNRKQQSESGRLSLSQDEAGARSMNTDIDSLNKLAKENQKVEATVTADVNADGDVSHHNLSEDLILNPKYAELARELRKEVLDGRREDSKDT